MKFPNLIPHRFRKQRTPPDAASTRPNLASPQLQQGSPKAASSGAIAGAQPAPSENLQPRRENQGISSPPALQNRPQSGFGPDDGLSSLPRSVSRASSSSSLLSGKSVFMPSSPQAGNHPASFPMDFSRGRLSSDSMDSSLYRSSEQGSRASSDHGSFASLPPSPASSSSLSPRPSFESTGGETRNSIPERESSSPPSPTRAELIAARRQDYLARKGGGT